MLTENVSHRKAKLKTIPHYDTNTSHITNKKITATHSNHFTHNRPHYPSTPMLLFDRIMVWNSTYSICLGTGGKRKRRHILWHCRQVQLHDQPSTELPLIWTHSCLARAGASCTVKWPTNYSHTTLPLKPQPLLFLLFIFFSILKIKTGFKHYFH